MNGLDYARLFFYMLCAGLVIAGAYHILRYIRKDRFYPPEEHEGIDDPMYGNYCKGGWVTLVEGVAMFIGGFVLLFMFG